MRPGARPVCRGESFYCESAFQSHEKQQDLDMQFFHPHTPVFCVLVLVGLFGLGRAPTFAQHGSPAPDKSGEAPPIENELKSKTTAQLASVGAVSGTVGAGLLLVRRAARGDGSRWPGICLAGSGVLVAPSTGLVYAEAPGRALKGIGIRAGIGLGTAALTSMALSAAESNSGPERGVSEDPDFSGLVVVAAGVLIGGGSILAHAALDAFVHSVDAVEAHNEATRAERSSGEQSSVSVGPWLSPHEGRPGVQVRVSL